MARVLAVDDDPSALELVSFTLQSEGHDVRTAPDAASALREMPLFQPEVVVLDFSLPDGTGAEVCQQIRQVSRVPVLFLTGRGSEVDKARGFRSGADDYLVKPFLPTELALRVEALLRRSAWSQPTPSTTQVGDIEVDGTSRVVRRNGEMLSLSPMEFDILSALASTPGSPWSAERLARRLGMPISSPTEAAELMRVKMSRLRRKVEPDPTHPVYLHSRRGSGYLLVPRGMAPSDGDDAAER
ncbi:MAG TPA: response regulator transcription factor [Chloroflexota bacterium]|nr:response regulator transcription factor [Chloroflexota bacterium]